MTGCLTAVGGLSLLLCLQDDNGSQLHVKARLRRGGAARLPAPPAGEDRAEPAGPPGASANPLLILRGNPGPVVPVPSASDPNALLSLVQQFSSMQQNMFDQFQQTLVMLVQMMSTMHHEQVSLVQEELRQLRQVTEELQRLQEQARQTRRAILAAAATLFVEPGYAATPLTAAQRWSPS